MNWQFLFGSLLALTILAAWPTSTSAENVEKVEESTESPIADMAIMMGDEELKTSTEKPPLAMDVDEKSDKIQKSEKTEKPEEKPQSQRHTVADFIIHPLIAFKPRSPEDDSPGGKQAETANTTVSPWQLFGFNAGQGLGSSMTSLTNGISGWLSDRIQLPGLVDTPVRESSTTTTTTTTLRPDIIVQVKQKVATTKKPIIRIDNRNRPNRIDFDSVEEEIENAAAEEEEDDDAELDESGENVEEDQDDEEDDGTDNNRIKNSAAEDEDNEDENEMEENENDDDDEVNEEEEEIQEIQRPKARRRQQQKRRGFEQQRKRGQSSRRSSDNKHQLEMWRQQQRARKKQQKQNLLNNNDEDFYYATHSSMKRSKSQPGLIQLGQQSLLNQLRQLTRGQTPAEIGESVRKAQTKSKNKPQQAVLFVNRNGQPVYMAPELLTSGTPQYQYQYSPQVVLKKRPKPSMANAFPQPPLTTPLKRKGRPTQYITIPWAQLGIVPPDQIISLAEGMQAQPLIFNIPQSALNQMSDPNRKKKRPLVTPDAVPLLAEASIMDIFKPPKIPPSRTDNNAAKRPASAGTPIHIVAKPKLKKKMAAPLPQRVRPATVVEKAPVDTEEMTPSEQTPTDATESAPASPTSDEQQQRRSEKEFIVVGTDDEELGVTRKVQPVYGDARYVILNQGGGHYALRKNGRSLEQPDPVGIVNSHSGIEQQIPVQIVTETTPKREAEQISPEVLLETVAESKTVSPLQGAKEKESTNTAEIAKVESAVALPVTDDDKA